MNHRDPWPRCPTCHSRLNNPPDRECATCLHPPPGRCLCGHTPSLPADKTLGRHPDCHPRKTPSR